MKLKSALCLLLGLGFYASQAQKIESSDKAQKAQREYKNIIRYNLSGPLLFGWNYTVFGYERTIGKHQSFSVNAGKAVLPKVLEISTDSYTLSKSRNNNGMNLSLDYRFYLSNENKYNAPHGLYIGPYYSYNKFERDATWLFTNAAGVTNNVGTDTDFKIHTMGAEMGYQFILWNRLALDFVLIGPGMSKYNLSTNFDGNISLDDKTELQEAIKQLISQKFPGMDYVLADKTFDAKGNVNTWNAGFRYIIHIGFRF